MYVTEESGELKVTEDFKELKFRLGNLNGSFIRILSDLGCVQRMMKCKEGVNHHLIVATGR